MTGCIDGSCICGKVKYSIEDDFKFFKICHCKLCQKASGSAHVANLFTEPGNINWLEGEELLTQFDVPNSQVRRVFCKQCGTSMPFKLQNGMYLVVPVGSLSTSPSIKPDEVRSWESRADWYEEALHLHSDIKSKSE